MRLAGKLIQEIIGRPGARFSGSGVHRALGRLPVNAPATLFPIHDDLLEDPIQVLIQDISVETVGIVSREAMMPGAGLIICLTRQTPDPLVIRCAVVRCNRLRGGHFAIGARFVGILDNKVIATRQTCNS